MNRENTLKEIIPQTVEAIFRADVAINALVGKLCKASMILVMHRIAYRHYLRETAAQNSPVRNSPVEQDKSNETTVDWWDEFIDEDAVATHGVFVSPEKLHEIFTQNQDSTSGDTQGDEMNNGPAQDPNSDPNDHFQASTPLQSPISTVETAHQDVKASVSYRSRPQEDIDKSGVAERILYEEAVKNFCSGESNGKEQEKDHARLGFAAADSLKIFRETLVTNLGDGEHAEQLAPDEITESEVRDAMVSQGEAKQPEIELDKLAVNKIKPVDDNEPACTFCENE